MTPTPPAIPPSSRSAFGGPSRSAWRPRGTVLIATMWIMVVLTGLVLVLARSMRVEAISSANHASAQQAVMVEQGAIQYMLAGLDGLKGAVPTEAELPCNGIQIGNGAFWVIRSGSDDDKQYQYGPVDEASKLNLNTATAQMLECLPNMTAEIAASIVDWRDEDSETTDGGAESDYYLLLAEPYECKNAPFETVEELFLVKEVSEELLFGEDDNRNGLLEPNEDDADASDPPDNRDGALQRGIAAFVTVCSAEPNTASDGSARVNVNDAQGQQLTEVLSKGVASERVGVMVDRIRRGRPFSSVLDFYFRTELTMEEFKPLADFVTTSSSGGGGQTGQSGQAGQSAQTQSVRGLVNVNTAPAEVLACLPGLDESDVSALLSARSGQDAEAGGYAWIADALSREKATAIGPFITAWAYRFSADIVSVSGDGRAFRRCRVILDAQQSPPRVIRRRDLTALGWPLDERILQLLRGGAPLEEVLKMTSQEVW